jgi:ArsR family transcriptional regulator, lead/cadmium/zinc/bismuth-responsive transcriptional repressor
MAGATRRKPAARGPGPNPRPRKRLAIDDDTYERVAAFFRAAGDVSRLKVLARLTTGEWSVSELAKAANVGMSTMSQQLRLLRAERLVARHREGKRMLYRLADSHIRRMVRAALEHAEHHRD